jgi:hypothetical protein
MAKSSGLRLPQRLTPQLDKANFFSKNCNPSGKDGHVAWGTDGQEALLRYIEADKLQFLPIERIVPFSPYPFGRVVMLGVFRHPIRRALSQCGAPSDVINGRRLATKDFAGCYKRRPNYQVRVYVACAAVLRRQGASQGVCQEAADLDTVPLGADDLKHAMEVFDHFNLIIPTERLGDNSVHELLHTRFGWVRSDGDELRAGTHKVWMERKDPAESLAKHAPALFSIVQATSQLDLAAYSHLLARLDAEYKDLERYKQLSARA